MCMASIDLSQIVHTDSAILGGAPVFVGTRVPVQSFNHLESGDSIEDFLEGFPSVQREQVIAVLEKSQIIYPGNKISPSVTSL